MKEIKEFKVLLEGNPSAEALVSQEPLSFWGGVDVASGDVLDIHHDLCGENVTGKCSACLMTGDPALAQGCLSRW